MTPLNTEKSAPALSGNGSLKSDRPASSITSNTRSSWRDQYRVHPAADVFPMMSEEELAKLGEDIKTNGLKTPITFFVEGDKEPVLLDGRNRLEAMERAGIDHTCEKTYCRKNPVREIVSLNIYRRHLTKEQQADLIVAAHKAEAAKSAAPGATENIARNDSAPAKNKPRQRDEVSRGGRGKVSKVKAAAVATAKEHGISKRTVERSLAKADGKKPEPEPIAGPRLKAKPKLETRVGIDAARRYYLERCKDPGVDLDAEQATVLDTFREIAGRRMMARQAARAADWPDLPDSLNRKLNKESLGAAE